MANFFLPPFCPVPFHFFPFVHDFDLGAEGGPKGLKDQNEDSLMGFDNKNIKI